MRFEDLRLTKPLLEAVRTAGYETPTPIQAKVIPLILDGLEVLACAQTGTGKTAAFALPILQCLETDQSAKHKNGGQPHQPRRNIRALVLAPTRELAQQISDSFTTYGRFCGLKHTVVYGGVNKNPQARALRKGVDILVATPGRLFDHMSDGAIKLNSVEILVLDEADCMLDMGFLPDIQRILKKVPQRRQTILLSATMPPSIRELAEDIMTDPVSVESSRVSSPAENVEHWAYRVEKNEKKSLLCTIFEHTAYTRALVFSRTKYGADKIVRYLTQAGVSAVAIHGNKTQNARTRALASFRSGKIAVMVATDIAARGLDIDNISHVINYDLTDEPEIYVHRIGRTGRAGAKGTALSFVSSEDRGKLRAIERLIRTPLQPADDLPGYIAPEVILEPKIDNPDKAANKNGYAKRNKPRYGSNNGSKNGSRRRPRRAKRETRSAVA